MASKRSSEIVNSDRTATWLGFLLACGSQLSVIVVLILQDVPADIRMAAISVLGGGGAIAGSLVSFSNKITKLNDPDPGEPNHEESI